MPRVDKSKQAGKRQKRTTGVKAGMGETSEATAPSTKKSTTTPRRGGTARTETTARGRTPRGGTTSRERTAPARGRASSKPSSSSRGGRRKSAGAGA